MPKRVRRKANTRDAYPLPKYLEIPLKVADGDGCIVFCPKYESGNPTIEIAKKRLAQFDREGYHSVFSAFAQHLDGELVEVHVFLRYSKNLRNAKPGIKNRQCHHVGAQKVCALCFVPDDGRNVVC